MIHPNTEIKYIDESIGFGVFATEIIPEGTITYLKDSLEIVISLDEYSTHSEAIRKVIENSSYLDESGNRIVSWDHAKFVNHGCQCNTISTGYGFEMAITNIEIGEQITDQYGLFRIENGLGSTCDANSCRIPSTKEELDKLCNVWDQKVMASLRKLMYVKQPLLAFVSQETKEDLAAFFENADNYKSVKLLDYKIPTQLNT